MILQYFKKKENKEQIIANKQYKHVICESKIFLNENNFSQDDCILILRTILNKSKRLLNIIKRFEEIKNIEEVISNTKPPIFWKDKEIVKNQVKNWKMVDLKKKIYQIFC